MRVGRGADAFLDARRHERREPVGDGRNDDPHERREHDETCGRDGREALPGFAPFLHVAIEQAASAFDRCRQGGISDLAPGFRRGGQRANAQKAGRARRAPDVGQRPGSEKGALSEELQIVAQAHVNRTRRRGAVAQHLVARLYGHVCQGLRSAQE